MSNNLKNTIMKVTLCTPIDVLDLGDQSNTQRVIETLKKNNINTISDLCGMKLSALKKLPDIGAISFVRIREFLSRNNLHVGMTEEEMDNFCVNHCTDYPGHLNYPDKEEEEEKAREHTQYADADREPDFDAMHNPDAPIDWEQRLFDVARDEFNRLGSTNLNDKSRARAAIIAALAFITIMHMSIMKMK